MGCYYSVLMHTCSGLLLQHIDAGVCICSGLLLQRIDTGVCICSGLVC